MNLKLPFFRFPSFGKKFNYESFEKKNPETFKNESITQLAIDYNKKEPNSDNTFYIDIFGIRLEYDDILLIGLIFFLYKEEVDDNLLFIALILLLLS